MTRKLKEYSRQGDSRSTLPCPCCGSLRVICIDTRWSITHQATKRRKECEKCRNRFPTYEVYEAQLREEEE